MKLVVVLTPSEIAELDRQHPGTKTKGGWQNLLVNLQERVDRRNCGLALSPSDFERIRRYAFRYRRGGWQARLLRIFGRTLGPNLDGLTLERAA